MEQKHKSVSLADQVFERLESEILSGKYARGELLTESRLCTELGVSRTPVREAIRRLEQEHIVEESSRGIQVLGITREDIRDIFVIRSRIEGLAAAATARNATDEQIARLKETLDLQGFYVEQGNADQIRLMDSRFHEFLYQYSGSSVLFDTLLPLHRKAQKVRRISVSDPQHAHHSLAEHLAIFEAVAAHDAARAEQLTIEHVGNAEERIMGKEVQ